MSHLIHINKGYIQFFGYPLGRKEILAMCIQQGICELPCCVLTELTTNDRVEKNGLPK